MAGFCLAPATSLVYPVSAREGCAGGRPGNCQVSDIFQEVDEEVRRERLQKLWERYQNYFVAIVALVVLGVAGWRTYDYLETKKAAESGTAFEVASQLAEDGKHMEAEAAFAKIAAEGTASYRTLARLREAAEIAARDPKLGIDAYRKVAADGKIDPVIQDLAALRAGALQLDAGAFADVKATLDPLTGDGRAFRHSARELLVLGAWRSGDLAEAKRLSSVIMTDGQTPPGMRTRIEMLVALIAAADTKG
jgi:hypothetical protein